MCDEVRRTVWSYSGRYLLVPGLSWAWGQSDRRHREPGGALKMVPVRAVYRMGTPPHQTSVSAQPTGLTQA